MIEMKYELRDHGIVRHSENYTVVGRYSTYNQAWWRGLWLSFLHFGNCWYVVHEVEDN